MTPHKKNGGADTPPLADYVSFSVPIASWGWAVLVELAPALLTADSVPSLLAELLTPLFPPDGVLFPFTWAAWVDPHATRSDVDTLSDRRQARDGEQAGCDQPSGDDMFHVCTSKLGR